MLLRTLLAHYRRHPVQAVFLLVSIVMANVLLVGTQLINAQARASYAEGERVLRAAPVGQLRPAGGAALSERDYVSLRRQGFDMLVPTLRQVVRTEDGEPVELMGIDALAMPRVAGRDRATLRGEGGNAGFALPPYQLWASRARLEQLGWREGQVVRTAAGAALPAVRGVAREGLGHRLLIDLGALQALTGTAGELSAILVFAAPPDRLSALLAALPPGLAYVATEAAPDPAGLTRSFHLNLAAMGLLAFVVGVFLTYNALAFSYTDRHELLRKLRLAGVTRSELRRTLLLELGLFLGLGSVAGGWLGAQLAAALLPEVGRTLAQLYGVHIAYPDALAPGGAWLPLTMTGLAAGLCVLYPMRQALRAPLLERWTAGWRLQAVARRDRGLLAVGGVLLLAALLLAHAAGTTRVALVGMAALLLGAALCLPAVLRGLLTLAARRVPGRRARLAWLVADSRWLLGPAALALMAMTLALVANSGLNTMIHSFRLATDAWLTQRLVAPLYVRADLDQPALLDWLRREAPAAELVDRFRTAIDRTTPAGHVARVEVVSLQEAAAFHGTVTLMRQAADAQARFQRGEGLFVSERAWRLDGWQVGDEVELCEGQDRAPVLGIYPDYGNPLSQWLVGRERFRTCWPDLPPLSLALAGPETLDWAGLRQRLAAAFELGEDDLITRAELKGIGLAVFDRTFRITDALNTLTLLVAGIGIFCAVSAIHHHRVVQQALLAALGLGRRERGALLLLQWGLLGALCLVLVWPFGTLLAGFLAYVVTPVAFGWSFPLRPQWSHYGVLAALAVMTLLLAVMLPSARLLRASPAALLREETL